MRNAQPIVPANRAETAAAFRYSPAVKAGPFLFISGIVGRGADGAIPAAFEDELRNVFEEMGETLAEAGGSFADIVAFDTFHVTQDFGPDLKAFIDARVRHMPDGDPAWTAIGIERLGLPDARIEVRVTAYLKA